MAYDPWDVGIGKAPEGMPKGRGRCWGRDADSLALGLKFPICPPSASVCPVSPTAVPTPQGAPPLIH